MKKKLMILAVFMLLAVVGAFGQTRTTLKCVDLRTRNIQTGIWTNYTPQVKEVIANTYPNRFQIVVYYYDGNSDYFYMSDSRLVQGETHYDTASFQTSDGTVYPDFWTSVKSVALNEVRIDFYSKGGNQLMLTMQLR